MSARFNTDPKTFPLGADEHAPAFSSQMGCLDVVLMEQAAAGRERDAMLEYERLQEERIKTVRETGMRALRAQVEKTIEERQRAGVLERQLAAEHQRLWLERAIAMAFAIAGFVFWLVSR